MIIILIVIIAACLYLIFKPSVASTIPLTINNEVFNLEVAKTVQQHTIGLMNRQYLCPNCGMIFIFGLELPQSFWMKNTLIPLDIIFLDKNGQVINISQGTPKSLDLIPSVKPAQYVIELNAGVSQRINLHTGDSISLPW
ncbi:MAG: DUF192 domain-containing protein [Candidatus Shapirobacteria bacterium]|nr:DUF192 domain-containing protein [Candidatus Shapirobacteria bacterium]